MTVWMSLFCWTQRKIFWRMWETEQFWGTIDSHSIYFSYYESQWCPKTAWLQTFFKISSFVSGRTKKFIQVWGCVNDRIFIFGWTIPLVLLFSKDTLNWSKVMIKTFLMWQKIYISDKCCSSELSIHQRNLKKILLSCFQQNNNNTYFWAANQNDRIMWLE